MTGRFAGAPPVRGAGRERPSITSQSQWIFLCDPFHRRTTGTRCWTNNLQSITKGSMVQLCFCRHHRLREVLDGSRRLTRPPASAPLTYMAPEMSEPPPNHADHYSRIDLCSSASIVIRLWTLFDPRRALQRCSRTGCRQGLYGRAASHHTGSELITALLQGEPWWPTDWLRGYSRVDLYLRALRIEQIFSCCERCRRISGDVWADCGRATLSAQPTLVGRVDCTTNAAGVRYAVGGVRSTYREIQSSARR
jgi:hypothetical protein